MQPYIAHTQPSHQTGMFGDQPARCIILFSRLILALLATGMLSGCQPTLRYTIKTIFSDPRDVRHAYYAKVRLDAALGNIPIHAVRYANVYYLHGGIVNDRNWPYCDSSIPRCWAMTDHYFLGLPNGDIMDIPLPPDKIPLIDLRPETPLRITVTHVGILRDQVSPAGRTCNFLSAQSVHDTYDTQLPIPGHADENAQVFAEVVKIDSIAGTKQVFDPSDFYDAIIVDKTHCSDLRDRVSQHEEISHR